MKTLSLPARVVADELMDSPALPPGEVERALRGLARLNALSGAPGLLWRFVRDEVRALGRPASLFDVATGSADVPIALHRLAAREGLTLNLTACDIRAEMRDMASRSAERAGVPLRVIPLDAVRDRPPGIFDIITVSLFTHHLNEDEVVSLLRGLAPAAGRLLVVSDLARAPLNLAIVSLTSRLVSRSRVVHTDAALSVRAAFTHDEFMLLAQRAGLHRSGVAAVHNAPPCRFVFTWRPAGA